jgi:hypothetical protein
MLYSEVSPHLHQLQKTAYFGGFLLYIAVYLAVFMYICVSFVTKNCD